MQTLDEKTNTIIDFVVIFGQIVWMVSGKSKSNDSANTVAGIYVAEEYAQYIWGQKAQELASRIGADRGHTQDRHNNTLSRGRMTPKEFLVACVNRVVENAKDVKSVAVATFGPYKNLDSSRMSKEYGVLSTVPNYEGWANCRVFEIVTKAFKAHGCEPLVRVYTDVDVAAFGEHLYRAGNGKLGAKRLKTEPLVYLKFSRSISGSLARNGEIVRGMTHPIMSVYRPQRYSRPDGKGEKLYDGYTGCCNHHGDCIEGLIGVKALENRTGKKFHEISNNDGVWDLVAFYVAGLCAAVSGFETPRRIILGGRIIREEHDIVFSNAMLKRVREYFYEYISNDSGALSPEYLGDFDIEDFICLPDNRKEHRGPKPGLHGAIRQAAVNLDLK